MLNRPHIGTAFLCLGNKCFTLFLQCEAVILLKKKNQYKSNLEYNYEKATTHARFNYINCLHMAPPTGLRICITLLCANFISH